MLYSQGSSHRKGPSIFLTRQKQRPRTARRIRTSSDDTPAATEAPDKDTVDDSQDNTPPVHEAHGHGDGATWDSLIPERIRHFWSTSESAQYLKECYSMLWKNLWTLMSLTALNSAARFVLVWTLYKTVCAVAVHLFGVPAGSIPKEMIPSSGSSGDPNVYQQLADITFLVFKPFDFVLRGVFVAAAFLACWESAESNPSTGERSLLFRKGWICGIDAPKRFKFIRGIFNGFVASLRSALASLQKSPTYIVVYIVMGALTAFYQALCLFMIPIMYAIRRLMNIQLAFALSLMKGYLVDQVFNEVVYRDKMEGVQRGIHYYGAADQKAFILSLLLSSVNSKVMSLIIRGIRCGCRLLGFTRDMVVKLFPDRLFVDVPEITWGLIATTTVTAFLIDRMAEIFPIVLYVKAKETTPAA